jgi:hypothetical protein
MHGNSARRHERCLPQGHKEPSEVDNAMRNGKWSWRAFPRGGVDEGRCKPQDTDADGADCHPNVEPAVLEFQFGFLRLTSTPAGVLALNVQDIGVAAGLPISIGTRSEKRASILSNRILLHLTTRLCSLSGVSGAVAVPACAKVTILRAASRLE